MLEAHVRCHTLGKLDGCCMDLQMKEHNRALMNGDPDVSITTRGREDQEDREEIQDVRIVRNCII